MIGSKRDLEEFAAWQLIKMVKSAKLKPHDRNWVNTVDGRMSSTGAVTVAQTTRLRELAWRNREAINAAEEARERARKSMALEASGKSKAEVDAEIEKAKEEREDLGF